MPANLAKSDPVSNSQTLQQSRDRLLDHPLYESVNTAEHLRLFMREHVFAVWDFMSLLKRLQQIVTCCEVPWQPVRDANLARFINEIVLGEECDEDGQGGYTSHYELYLSAMEEIGADTRPVREFTRKLREGQSVELALAEIGILPSTRAFVSSTLQLTIHGQPHEVAAAFFYGREDVIPEMFERFVDSLPQEGISVSRMNHYLRRHIELDSKDHGPLAARLLKSLCGHDPTREREANQAAIDAISQRIQLWDGVYSRIKA